MSTQRTGGAPHPGNNGAGDLIGRVPGLRAPPSPARQEGAGAAMRTFLRVVRRRLPIVLVCTLLVPLATLAWSLHQEKQYESTAVLLFRNAKLDQSLTGSAFFSSTEAARAAETNVKLVSLRTVAERTAARLGAPGVSSGSVSESVEVSLEGESDVAKVSATTSDPDLAARMANTFAREYIHLRRDADRRALLDAQALVEHQLSQLTIGQRRGEAGQALSRQAQELGLVASLQTGNAELVQRAAPSDAPVSPRPLRNTAVGLILGLLLGVGLSLLVEQFDTRIKDEAGIEDAYGLPTLASVPHSGKVSQPQSSDPIGLGSPAAESFRMLHANLRYFNVGRKIDSLLVTSATPEEGKTTIAWGLSVTEAFSGTSVLLIEGDLRQPTLAARIGHSTESGLSLVLSGAKSFDESVGPVELEGDPVPNLHLLPAGPVPPNPAELLESQEMTDLLSEARSNYDLVVLDTPPIVVADSIPLMSQVSGVLIVARLRFSRSDSCRDLRELLDNLNALPFGTVANDAPPTRVGYYMPYAARARTPT
jgi:succinoglycan biosynthesis transport protein ExoP